MGVKQSPCNTKPELIYWDSQSFTLIKQTRQPWALETLVYPVCLKVFFFSCQSKQFPSTPQSRTSLSGTKPHGRQRVTWQQSHRCIVRLCIIFFHSHICHLSMKKLWPGGWRAGWGQRSGSLEFGNWVWTQWTRQPLNPLLYLICC